MTPKRLNPAEVLLVRAMRSLDGEIPYRREEIDRRLATEFETRLTSDCDLHRLARRAELVIAAEHGFEPGPAGNVAEHLKWLIVVGTVSACVLMVLWFGGRSGTLVNTNAEGEVAVFPVVEFVVGQLLLLFVSIGFMLAGYVRGAFGNGDAGFWRLWHWFQPLQYLFMPFRWLAELLLHRWGSLAVARKTSRLIQMLCNATADAARPVALTRIIH